MCRGEVIGSLSKVFWGNIKLFFLRGNTFCLVIYLVLFTTLPKIKKNELSVLKGHQQKYLENIKDLLSKKTLSLIGSIAFDLVLVSHAGDFFPHKRLLNRRQLSFPKLSQSHCTFQILESWPWPQVDLIITRSAWNTGKAFWPLINVRFRAAKVRCSQILEYFMHCITLANERKEGKR